jgi:ribosomal protein S3AE
MKVERKWISVVAPDYDNLTIGETYGNEAEIKGRTIMLYSGDLGYQNKNYKVTFKTVEIKGNAAEAKPIKLELLRDYISRMIRHNSTKRDVVIKTTIEGGEYYFKTLVLLRKCDRSKASAAVKATESYVNEFVKNKGMKQIIDEIINGKFKEGLAPILNKIHPVRAVEARMIEPVRK